MDPNSAAGDFLAVEYVTALLTSVFIGTGLLSDDTALLNDMQERTYYLQL
jgi:hypothetical protein